MTRVLVCGSRDYSDANAIFNALDALHATSGITALIEGEALGADTLARIWFEFEAEDDDSIELLPFPANWALHGKAAGPIRNKQMLVEGNPDIVYAFTNKPLSQSRGTLNMVTQARKAGVRTIVVGEDDTGHYRAAQKEDYTIQEDLF